jgi:hypothetical protein
LQARAIPISSRAMDRCQEAHNPHSQSKTRKRIDKEHHAISTAQEQQETPWTIK